MGLQLGGASTALSEQPAERWDGVGVTAESSLRVEGEGIAFLMRQVTQAA